MQYKKGFIGVLFALFVSGCSSVPVASFTDANQAKFFSTYPEKSNLYIYRSHIKNMPIEMEFDVDGQHVVMSMGQII